MAVSLDEIGEWMGKHPYLTGGSIVVGGLGILWLLGYFTPSQASGDSSGQTNMAAAYYAAEAAQAAAGAQIQGIALNTTAQTAQTQIAANAATQINSANTNRDIVVNGQNTGSANTIAGLGSTVQLAGIGAGQTVNLAGISGQVQATQINADAATSQNSSNNQTAAQVAQTAANASNVNTALQTIVPIEQMGAQPAATYLPGGQGIITSHGVPFSINDLIAQGYTPTQAQQLAGVTPG